MGLLLLPCALSIQAQNWDWAAVSGGTGSDHAYGTATDPNDNVILVGSYHIQDMVVGPYTLPNLGSSDCFISKYDAGGGLIWSRGIGSIGHDWLRRVTTDDQGNIYAVGDFNGPSMDCGNGYVLTNAGKHDAFIVKLDPNGNTLWAQSLGGVEREHSRDVVVTPCGVIWGGGFQSPNASILGSSITNASTLPNSISMDVFMCMVDPANGNVQWIESYGSLGDDVLMGLANRGGTVFATGVFTNTITFGGITHNNFGNNTDGWIARFKCNDPNSFNWSTAVGGTAMDNMMDITVGSGRVFVTGNSLSNTFTLPGLGANQMINGGSMRAVLFAYSFNGDPLWFRQGENPNSPYGDYGTAVEADKCGFVYGLGRFANPGITWSGTTLNSSSSFFNYYQTKYDVDGNLVWATHIPGLGGGGISGTDIAINSQNRPVVGGTLNRGATVGGINYYVNNYPTDYSDVIVMQMDDDLTMLGLPTGPICENSGFVNLEVLPAYGTGTWTCPSAPNALANSTTTGTHTNVFNPSNLGPGTFCITFTTQSNCPVSITECIEVLPAPNITFSPIPAVCNQGGLIDLAPYASPAGGVFAGAGVSGTLFDPTAPNVIVGSNAVSYTVTNPNTGCSDQLFFLVNVTDDRWHQSSLPSGYGDSPFDMVTDDEGNVYVTGSFSLSTTLTDNFGNNIPLNTSGYSMFVAKYSPCGALLWGSHASSGTANGYGVAVDESTDMVYVTGNYNGSVQFEDYCGTNVVNLNGIGGYVSQFDRNTGCHLFTESVPVGIESAPQACVAWDGNLYLTGQEDAAVGSPEFILFTSKYTPDAANGTANQLGSPVWHSPSASFSPSPRHISRDIEMDLSQPGGAQVVITGDFTKSLRYLTSPLSAFTYAERDAFYTIFDEPTGTPQVIEQFGAQPAPEYATGQGVTVNPNGRIYLTGTFKTPGPATPFNVAAPLNGGTTERAYLVETTSGGWSRELFANANGSVQGQALVASNNRLCVTGNFMNGTLNVGNLTLPFLSAQGSFKTFSTTFDLNGTPIGVNGSTSPFNNSSHIARAIGLGLNDTYFTTGYYIGDMNFLFDNSYTGPLPNQSIYSMFVLRSDLSSQFYFKSDSDDDGRETSLEVWPNPSEGHFSLRAPYLNADVEILNLQGQRVHFQNGRDLSVGLDLDVSSISKGTYFLKVTSSKGDAQLERIIIQ